MAFLFVVLLNAFAVVLGVRFARSREARLLQPLRAPAKLLLVICLPLGLLGVFNALLNDELHGLVDRYLLLAASALPILVTCTVLYGTRFASLESERSAPP